LGHKRIEMTMGYAHLRPAHKQKAVNLLSGLTAFEETEKTLNATRCYISEFQPSASL